MPASLTDSHHRGADALVQALRAAGTRVVFSLSGNHIMPVYDALVGQGIRLVHVRHEGAAVHMADAWARLTGEVGVALVTGGPGHANALGALYTAQMAESPVLLLSGHAPRGQLGRGAFQEMRQADLAAPLTQFAHTCTSAAELAADVARAMQRARSGRPGPVHLSLPTDVLEASIPRVAPPAPAAFAPQPGPLATADAAALLQSLRQAERPLILVGPAASGRAHRALLDRLQAQCGMPVIMMESPRGVADPSLGALAELLPRSDRVLLLGKRLDFTLKFGQAPAFDGHATWLQVDAQADEIARTRQAVGARLLATAEADLDSALSAMLALAPATTHGPAADHAGWCEQVRQAIAHRPPAWAQARSALPDRLHPVQALAPWQALLDSHPDAVFISDGGEIGQWAQACLQAPHRIINGVAGAIGAALPFALAARCALPDAPIVAVMGDGTFGFHAAEIDTAVRCGLPLVAVVGNDARWNAEHQIQLKDYGPERLIGCELQPTRYDQVAAAFGGHGEWVTRPEQVGPAARRAMDCGLPACVNIMIEGLPAPQIKRPAPPAP